MKNDWLFFVGPEEMHKEHVLVLQSSLCGFIENNNNNNIVEQLLN